MQSKQVLILLTYINFYKSSHSGKRYLLNVKCYLAYHLMCHVYHQHYLQFGVRVANKDVFINDIN